MNLTKSSALLALAVILFVGAAVARAQQAAPSQDVEQITEEAQRTPEGPLFTIDRPVYDALQAWKKDLSERHGINWALENTTIYQSTSGGVDPNDALVNTLGLFATWKIIRSDNGKDFGGIGFQGETRANTADSFPELRDSLGTLWSPNDSTSANYTKINQLWWGQRFGEGRFGFLVGKLDLGTRINENRFAGSGNTQFFGQPYATNPGRSFPDNGLGFMLRVEPTDWLFLHFSMSDSDAVSTGSPFTTINGHWFEAGEIGFKPEIPGLGPGIYRFMLYYRDADSANELGWALSFDQNLSEKYGVFLRYGGNDGDINSIEHIVSGGFSFLQPFDRRNDQAGIGVSWTHPTSSDLRDEYAAETYYRLQVTEGIELSASAQLVIDPSASDQDAVGVFGLRCRVLY
jgi:hypothetical protein